MAFWNGLTGVNEEWQASGNAVRLSKARAQAWRPVAESKKQVQALRPTRYKAGKNAYPT